ncbi:hypothetical protein AB0F17_18190 [Nonomuraea sp. NPDC026600]|uniref:hypothetical protein n=1 Tax=Nonomuraea sp. NPDC026600 TaxID=3155363 RepID=UPI0033CC4921
MVKKFAALITAVVFGVLALGAVATASAVTAPVKAYGICIAKTGAVRVLEAKALSKSRYGKCKTGEQRVLVPSVDGVPKAINGKSAYELWVAQPGNAGKTVADFLASLKGADGKDTSLPAKVQFKFDGVTAVCTKGADTAAGIPAYDCVKP